MSVPSAVRDASVTRELCDRSRLKPIAGCLCPPPPRIRMHGPLVDMSATKLNKGALQCLINISLSSMISDNGTAPTGKNASTGAWRAPGPDNEESDASQMGPRRSQ